MTTSETVESLRQRIELLESRLRRTEDIQEIQKLKALYCKYSDGGWEGQGPSHMGPVADLFVEDGVWDGGPNLPRFEGREAIRKFFEENRVVPFATHNVMNPIITVDGDEATGHWHVVGCFTLAKNESRWIVGNYIERYVRTPEGWRYKSIRSEIARTWLQPEGWGELDTVLDPAGKKG